MMWAKVFRPSTGAAFIIIDYAVPLFRQGGLYAGYPRLGSLIS
ncbi:MAG: hypothetical protein ACUVQ2_08275 [Dissulfurimicrobium sp.]